MLSPKNSRLPLTKTRLNFYLAQRAREVLEDSSITARNEAASKSSYRSKINIKYQSQCNDSLFGKSIQSIGKIEEDSPHPDLEKKWRNNRQNLEAICDRPGILRNRENQSPTKPLILGQRGGDSLDQIVSSRRYNMPFSERGDYHKNNNSGLSYFNHQNSSVHGKQNRRSVKWNNSFQTTFNSNERMGKNMKQLSNKLSSINFEVNRNNKKLKEFRQLQSPLDRPSKQQTLKRVNFKHSKAMQIDRTKAQELERVPRVEYYDRSYNEPRFLIWSPLH